MIDMPLTTCPIFGLSTPKLSIAWIRALSPALRSAAQTSSSEPEGSPAEKVALSLLNQLPAIDVTFMGRMDRINCEHSGGLAIRQLKDFNGRLRFLNDFSQADALRYIQSHGNALCVIPSLIENSPCVVGECFTISKPFICSDVGGVGELIATEDHERALFAPTAQGLCNILRRVWTDGLSSIKSTLNPADIIAQWRELCKELDAPPHAKPAELQQPLVSICVTHHERPELLQRTVASILAQTYRNIEVVIVDDGSRSKFALDRLNQMEAEFGGPNFRIIRAENRYLGATRNLAAANSRGEFLIFHADDNVAEPNELELFVAAALRGRFDVLTSQYFVFDDDEEPEDGKVLHFHLGIGGEFSYFRNSFGDANAIVRKDVFDRLGGFTELYGVGFEDWEFFLKAHLSGAAMGIVPLTLFRYRVSRTGMLATGAPILDHRSIIDAVDKLAPKLTSDFVSLARSSELSNIVLDKTWNILERQEHGALFQQLTTVEPNSGEAVSILMQLAFLYGRLDEAIELGIRSPDDRATLYRLLSATTSQPMESARLVIEQLPRVEQFFATVKLRGWICNRELVPTEFDELEIDGRVFSVTRLARISRPDVANEFDQKGQPLVGFELQAVETKQRNAPSIFRWGKKASKVPLRSTGKPHSKINIIARTTH